MLIVAGTARFQTEEDVGRLIDEGRTMIAASRKEPGCIDYAYARDVTDDLKIRVFEIWESQDALDKHFATPHMAAFAEALAGLKGAEIDVQIYDVSGTRPIGGPRAPSGG